MTRKEFLRLVSLGIPAGVILPSLLSSCRDKELFEGKTYAGKVIIVGAGAAGLYAAYLLLQRKVDVTILEASARYGGRILPLENFTDFTVELGAEEVHGQRSVWYDMVKASSGTSFVDFDAEEDYIQIDSILQKLSDLSGDADVNAANDLTTYLDTVYHGGDITAQQYIQQSNFPQRIVPFLDALLGNEWGTSNDRLGLEGAAEEGRRWTAGEQNFMVKNRSFLSILEEQLSGVFDHIRLNTAIKNIDYSGSSIVLTDQNSNTYTADKVIVTVPLPVLRDGDLTFAPALDAARVNAFSRIGMGAGLKVILKFNTRFWADDCGSIYGAGPVPEYWSTGTGGRGTENKLLTAFVMGAYAENLIALGLNMIPAILADLDSMYGAGVASNGNLIASHVMNWSAEPFIKGAYSFPVPGGSGARELIAASIDGKIYFAGEATHYAGHNSTVHGAMETGLRAVEEIFQSIS